MEVTMGQCLKMDEKMTWKKHETLHVHKRIMFDSYVGFLARGSEKLVSTKKKKQDD